MESRRQAKVSRLLQRELAMLLQKNARHWFSIPFVSVSRVMVSPDVSIAKVYLTFINENEPLARLETVRGKTAEIKRNLANTLRHELRKMPDLVFFYDDTLDYVEHMDKLFDKLNKEQGSSDQG